MGLSLLRALNPFSSCILRFYSIPINESLQETTQHGAKDFPLALYQTKLFPGSLRYVPIHWHKELQLCLVTEGTVCFTVNQEHFVVKAGDAFFINSKVVHCAGALSSEEASEGAAYICLDFGHELLGGFLGSRLEKEFVLPFIRPSEYVCLQLSKSCARHELILNRIQRIRDLYLENIEERSYDIFVCLVEIWRDLSAELKRFEPLSEGSRPEDSATVRGIIAFIENNFHAPVSLTEIAEAVNLSKGECSRRFKKITGKTIWTYLTSVRMAKAVELLLHSSKTIERIAYDCGFSNVNIFIRQFKKEFNLPPGQFRHRL